MQVLIINPQRTIIRSDLPKEHKYTAYNHWDDKQTDAQMLVNEIADKEAILLPNNWAQIKVCRLAHYYAQYVGIPILFHKHDIISMLDMVLQVTTGYTYTETISRDRHENVVRARRLICNALHNRRMTTTAIGELIGRDHSTVSYSLKAYRDEYQTSAAFRELADEFNSLMKTQKECMKL